MSKLPFKFNQIINYKNLYNLESRFNGYTYNAKNNSVSLNISNLNNINNGDINEIVDILAEAENNSKNIKELITEMSKLKQENKEIKSQINKKIDTNTIPIQAGITKTVGIDNKGIYSFEKDNPNRMIRFINGALGISRNGTNDFEVIANADGINPRFLPNFNKINIEKTITQEGSNSGGSGNSSSGNTTNTNQDSGSKIINNNTYITNPKIRYEDLPCKIFRNEFTKKVEKIKYYKDNELEYIETYNRNDTGKVTDIILEHIGQETEITALIRDNTGKVSEINVQYKDLDEHSEYIGMK